MAKAKAQMNELMANFLRGAIANGIVAAVQDEKKGTDLAKAAALGGAALSTAVAIENLVFNKGLTMGAMSKKAKKKNGKKAQQGMLNADALQMLLQGQQTTGLAALTPTQQLLVGVLIGAGAAYVLSDEKLRDKLLHAGMRLYTGLAGGFEEIKEQVADIQAEMAAERMSAE